MSNHLGAGLGLQTAITSKLSPSAQILTSPSSTNLSVLNYILITLKQKKIAK